MATTPSCGAQQPGRLSRSLDVRCHSELQLTLNVDGHVYWGRCDSDIYLFGDDFETFPTHMRHLPFPGGGVKLVRRLIDDRGALLLGRVACLLAVIRSGIWVALAPYKSQTNQADSQTAKGGNQAATSLRGDFAMDSCNRRRAIPITQMIFDPKTGGVGCA